MSYEKDLINKFKVTVSRNIGKPLPDVSVLTDTVTLKKQYVCGGHVAYEEIKESGDKDAK